jgi:hypothetical protein
MERHAAGVTVVGEWSPSEDAALVMVWDNAYSYLTEKQVAFHAAIIVAVVDTDIAVEERPPITALAPSPLPVGAAHSSSSSIRDGGTPKAPFSP